MIDINIKKQAEIAMKTSGYVDESDGHTYSCSEGSAFRDGYIAGMMDSKATARNFEIHEDEYIRMLEKNDSFHEHEKAKLREIIESLKNQTDYLEKVE